MTETVSPQRVRNTSAPMAEAVSCPTQSPLEFGHSQRPVPDQFPMKMCVQAPEAAAAGQQPQEQVPDSLPATKQQHAGIKGQLAVQIKPEDSLPQYLLYSTGSAASDVAQDTTVAAAPAAVPLSCAPGVPASTGGSGSMLRAGGQQVDASSPSSGVDDSAPGPAGAQLAPATAAADDAAAEAAVLAPALQQQALLDEHQQQQQQQVLPGDAAAAGQEAEQPAYGFGTAAAADEQAAQQQQQVAQYSLGLELLGEAADLLPQEGPISAAAAAAAAAMHSHPHHHQQHQALYVPSAAAAARLRAASGGRKNGAARQARASLSQLMYEGGGYGEPSMPIITKPDGVACQVPGCHANLNAAGVSTYFRRHRVCLSHAKADQVVISGTAMRFCQQCGIMHPLGDFDGSRKSCRVQLDRHNLRRRCRRKTQMQTNKAAAAAAAAAAGTSRKAGGHPESSSRGRGGSSVSPSGAGGASPQRGPGGGKRAAARGAAAAFAAAAAASGSDGLSYETSRDVDGERMIGDYTYGDADYLGSEYGATAADALLDPAAEAGMPVHGGYGYQQPQQGRRGMRKSGSISSLAWEGTGAAAAVAAAAAAAAEPYPGIGQHAGARLSNMHAGGDHYGMAAAYPSQMQQQMMQYGYNQQHQQHGHHASHQQQQHAGGWDAGLLAGSAAGDWPADSAAAAANGPGSAVAAPVDAAGQALSLQQLRLHIASAIAGGKGPGIKSIRRLGFVLQLHVVDELATGLHTELSTAVDAAGGSSSMAPAQHMHAHTHTHTGGSYSQQQHHQHHTQVPARHGAAGVEQPHSLSVCPSPHGASAAASGLAASIAEAAVAAAAGGAGPQQLMALLGQLAESNPAGLSSLRNGSSQQQQQQHAGGSLASPSCGGGGGGGGQCSGGSTYGIKCEHAGASHQQQQQQQRHYEEQQQHAQLPAKRARVEPGFREQQQQQPGSDTGRRAAAAAAAASMGVDTQALLRQLLRMSGAQNSPALSGTPTQQQQQQQMSPGPAAASSLLAAAVDEEMAEAGAPAATSRPAPDRGEGGDAMMNAAAALLAVAGVKAEAMAAAGGSAAGSGHSDLSGLISKAAGASRPSSAPAAHRNPSTAAGGAAAGSPVASPTAAGHEARASGGARSARASSSQIGAMQAALLRSLASGLTGGAPAGSTDPASSGRQQQQFGAAGPRVSSGTAAADGGDPARGGSGGETGSPRHTAMLLSSLLQQLASAKR